MDPNTAVLEISSDEDADRSDNRRGGDDDSDDVVVVVVSETERPVKKPRLKVKLKMKRSSVVDLDDDCVVLDEDPNADAAVRSDDCGGGGDGDDVVVVSEKGQVACRDYPHSRHLCIKFPFSTTPNQSHCNQCYCYVCDSLAPCVYWGNGSASTHHCRATDKDEFWRRERKNAKNGNKPVQPISQPPLADSYAPTLVMAQSQNQFPNSHAPQPSDVINLYRKSMLASSNRSRQDWATRLERRVQQKYNAGRILPIPVVKRTNSVRAATTVNLNSHSSYRGVIRNPTRRQNYQVNGTLSGSSKYLRPLQPNAANTSVPYPPQSQTYKSSTLNLPQSQPQPQFYNHSNPNIQSHVNSNPIPESTFSQQLSFLPPLSSQPQSVSSQQTYTMQAQPSGISYPVSSSTKVDSPLVPVSDFNKNTSQGNQSQSPVVDWGFKDHGLGLPTGQDSATLEGAVSTSESPLAPVSSGLADYRFDLMFDNQPIEPGFTDYSFDSTFIDTGPIFDF